MLMLTYKSPCMKIVSRNMRAFEQIFKNLNRFTFEKYQKYWNISLQHIIYNTLLFPLINRNQSIRSFGLFTFFQSALKIYIISNAD